MVDELELSAPYEREGCEGSIAYRFIPSLCAPSERFSGEVRVKKGGKKGNFRHENNFFALNVYTQFSARITDYFSAEVRK